MSLKIIPAAVDHAAALHPRDVDLRECKLLFSLYPFQKVLERSITHSLYSYTFLLDGEIVGVGGVQETSFGDAYPWLVGSDLLTKEPKEFHALLKQLIREIPSKYSRATCLVADFNEKHIRWLERLGFVGRKIGYDGVTQFIKELTHDTQTTK